MQRVLLASLAAIAASGCVSTTAQTSPKATSYADFLIGLYAERSRDPVVAAERYASALRNTPRDAMLLEGAAESALAAGDASSAAHYGRRADAQDVHIASGRLAQAALALRDGRAKDVPALLDSLDGAPTELLSARLISVWASAEQRDGDAALVDLGEDTLPARSPWAALQHYQRAMVLDFLGRDEAALAAYAKGRASGGLRVAQVILHHGQLLERTGRKDEAAALYREFLVDVDNPGIAAELARLNDGRAPPHTLNAARGASIGLFSLAVLIGHDPSGREQLGPLSLAMAVDPTLEAPRIAFADAMRGMQQSGTATRVLSAIPASSPYYETAQSQIAYALRAEGRDDEALATLKAVAERTNGRVSRRALADLYRNMDRNAEAAPLYAGLVSELDPPSRRDWRLFFAQGATLERLGQWPAAEAALQQALLVSPDQPEVLNYLGYTWVDTGVKVTEGLAILERAVAQQPDEGYIIDSLGWAHFKLGNYVQATELLERAVELSPGDSTLNDHLGDAYWRVGRRIEARYQWRRVLSLKGPDAERAAAERKIAEGLPALPR
ncbi:MAG: tetratricopeptide repeat protein [Alphaproteobacteria bacterium]|nr:tetratricopeptide repeat protein [Alphaproteobacteria bacterium]